MDDSNPYLNIKQSVSPILKRSNSTEIISVQGESQSLERRPSTQIKTCLVHTIEPSKTCGENQYSQTKVGLCKVHFIAIIKAYYRREFKNLYKFCDPAFSSMDQTGKG